MTDPDSHFDHRLTQRIREGNLRKLVVSELPVDFVSNDYLGLSRNKALRSLIHDESLKIDHRLNGSTGSRLLSGNSRSAEALEEFLCGFFGSDNALLFSSGYLANIAVLSSLPQKGDTIIYDELSHASIKDGARLSFAKRYTFRHNDPDDLERKLKKAGGNKFVVVESVYSMDGDQAPLEPIDELCTTYKAFLIIDEAHSTGLYGKHGEGLAAHLENPVRIMTFGKGVGAHGASVLGPPKLRDYLVNFARPFIYTTAMPVHSLIAIKEGLKYIREHQELREELFTRIDYFKLKAGNSGFADSAIQAIRIPGNERVKEVTDALNRKGLDVRPILSPTVKKGEERIRICLHSFNTFEEIDMLVNELKQQRP